MGLCVPEINPDDDVSQHVAHALHAIIDVVDAFIDCFHGVDQRWAAVPVAPAAVMMAWAGGGSGWPDGPWNTVALSTSQPYCWQPFRGGSSSWYLKTRKRPLPGAWVDT